MPKPKKPAPVIPPAIAMDFADQLQRLICDVSSERIVELRERLLAYKDVLELAITALGGGDNDAA